MGTQVETDDANMTAMIEDLNDTHLHVFVFFVPGQQGEVRNHLFFYVQYNLQVACGTYPQFCKEEDLDKARPPVFSQIVEYEMLFRVGRSEVELEGSLVEGTQGRHVVIRLTNRGGRTLTVKKILSDLKLRYPNSNVFVDEDFEDERECFQQWVVAPNQTQIVAQSDNWLLPNREPQHITVSVTELNPIRSEARVKTTVLPSQRLDATMLLPGDFGSVRLAEEHIDFGIFTEPNVVHMYKLVLQNPSHQHFMATWLNFEVQSRLLNHCTVLYELNDNGLIPGLSTQTLLTFFVQCPRLQKNVAFNEKLEIHGILGRRETVVMALLSGGISQDLLSVEKEGSKFFPSMLVRVEDSLLRKTLYIRDRLPREFEQEEQIYLGRLDIFARTQYPAGLQRMQFFPSSREALVAFQKNSLPASSNYSKLFTVLAPRHCSEKSFETIRAETVRVIVFGSHTPVAYVVSNKRLICRFFDEQEGRLVEDFCFKLTHRLLDFGFVAANSWNTRRVDLLNLHSEQVEIRRISGSDIDVDVQLSSILVNPFESTFMQVGLSTRQNHDPQALKWLVLETDSEAQLNFTVRCVTTSGDLFFLPGTEVDLGDVSLEAQPSFVLRVNSTFPMPIDIKEIKVEDRSWVLVAMKTDKIKKQNMTQLAVVSLDLVNLFGEDIFVGSGAPLNSATGAPLSKRPGAVNGVTLEEIEEEQRRARFFEQNLTFQTVLEVVTAFPSKHKISVRGRISQVSLLPEKKIKMPLMATGVLGSQIITLSNPSAHPVWFMLFLAPHNVMEAGRLLQDPDFDSKTGEINLQIQGEHLLMSTTAASTLHVIKDVLDFSAAQPPLMRVVPVRSSLFQKWLYFFTSYFSSGAIRSLKYADKDIHFAPEAIVYKSLPKVAGDSSAQKWKALSQDIYLNETFFLKRLEMGPFESVSIPALSYLHLTDKRAQVKLLVKNNLTRLEALEVFADPARIRLNVKGMIFHPNQETDIHFFIESSETNPVSKTLLKPLRRVVKIENSGTVPVDISYLTIEHQGCSAFGLTIQNCYPFSIQPGKYHELVITFLPSDLKRRFEKRLYLANANNLFLNTFYLKMESQYSMAETMDPGLHLFLKAFCLLLCLLLFFGTPQLIRSSMRTSHSKAAILAPLNKTNKQPKVITKADLDHYAAAAFFYGQGKQDENAVYEDSRKGKEVVQSEKEQSGRACEEPQEKQNTEDGINVIGFSAQNQKKTHKKQAVGKKGRQGRTRGEKEDISQQVSKPQKDQKQLDKEKENVDFEKRQLKKKNPKKNLRLEPITPSGKRKEPKQEEVNEEKNSEVQGTAEDSAKNASEVKKDRTHGELSLSLKGNKRIESVVNEPLFWEKHSLAEEKKDYTDQEKRKKTCLEEGAKLKKEEILEEKSDNPKNLIQSQTSEKIIKETTSLKEFEKSLDGIHKRSPRIEVLSKQGDHPSERDLDAAEESKENKSDSLEEMDKSFNSFSSSSVSENESGSTSKPSASLKAFLPPNKTQTQPTGFRSFLTSKLQRPPPKPTQREQTKQSQGQGVMKAYLEKYRQKQNSEEEHKSFDHKVLFPFFNSQQAPEANTQDQGSSSVTSQTLGSSQSGSSSPFQGPSVHFRGVGGLRDSSMSSSFSEAPSGRPEGDSRTSSFLGEPKLFGGPVLPGLGRPGIGGFPLLPGTEFQKFQAGSPPPPPEVIAQAKSFNLAFANPFSIRNFAEQGVRTEMPLSFDVTRDPIFGMREEPEISEEEDLGEEEKVSKKPPGFDFQ